MGRAAHAVKVALPGRVEPLSGPFQFVSWTRGAEVRLKAFPDYFLGKPKLTEVMITIGAFGWFLMNFSLFSKFLPIVSMTELKEGVGWLRKSARNSYPYRKAA